MPAHFDDEIHNIVNINKNSSDNQMKVSAVLVQLAVFLCIVVIGRRQKKSSTLTHTHISRVIKFSLIHKKNIKEMFEKAKKKPHKNVEN